MGIFDWKHWVVILVVVVLVFGTKKLKNLGGDLGETIKGFRRAMNEEDKPSAHAETPAAPPAIEQPSQSANAAPLTEDALKK